MAFLWPSPAGVRVPMNGPGRSPGGQDPVTECGCKLLGECTCSFVKKNKSLHVADHDHGKNALRLNEQQSCVQPARGNQTDR